MEKYALLLTDGPYTTLDVFEDEAMWNWLTQDVDFPSGKSEVIVDLPEGYSADPEYADEPTKVAVTIGSPDNDLWIGAASALPESCRVPVEYDGDNDDEDDDGWVAAARKECKALGIPDEHIIEGMYY